MDCSSVPKCELRRAKILTGQIIHQSSISIIMRHICAKNSGDKFLTALVSALLYATSKYISLEWSLHVYRDCKKHHRKAMNYSTPKDIYPHAMIQIDFKHRTQKNVNFTLSYGFDSNESCRGVNWNVSRKICFPIPSTHMKLSFAVHTCLCWRLLNWNDGRRKCELQNN